ncbi:peptidase M23 [Streptomyces sp. NPDC001795]|uniref:peptidase M23 n=1 Tax=Streptomyces sp. NPDC001795 TaxID=3154525 RepID=UPI0033234203
MDQRDVMRGALKATGAVKKGAQLKFGAIAMVVFLIGLIVLGMFFPAGKAGASACEDTGPGTSDASAVTDTSTVQASGTLHQQQITYAKAIDAAAKKAGLPGRATLIALMTAMQESTLQNLTHGDADSVGLFQQRPSMGWGTKAQITDPKTGPTFAATSFFLGRGGNSGLVDIKGWEKLPLGDAAQKVQKSAHPELYAGHESAMRKLAQEAGINVERGGSTTGNPNTSGGTAGSSETVTSENSCGVAQPTTPGGSAGGKFTDGKQTWKLNNPRSVAEAIAWAKAHSGAGSSSGWYQRCLAFTANVYGWSFSGVNYAIDHYKVVPASMRHDGDRHPPAGALMYWDTGHRAGHIAVYLGGGKVASNDILRPGYIDVVDAGLFETKWNAKYIGWTPPVFPRAG